MINEDLKRQVFYFIYTIQYYRKKHKTIIFMAQMERHLLLVSQTPKTFPSMFLISKGMEVAA